MFWIEKDDKYKLCLQLNDDEYGIWYTDTFEQLNGLIIQYQMYCEYGTKYALGEPDNKSYMYQGPEPSIGGN